MLNDRADKKLIIVYTSKLHNHLFGLQNFYQSQHEHENIDRDMLLHVKCISKSSSFLFYIRINILGCNHIHHCFYSKRKHTVHSRHSSCKGNVNLQLYMATHIMYSLTINMKKKTT